MARWYITSGAQFDSQAQNLSASAQLVPSGRSTGAGCFMQAYYKRAVRSANVLHLPNGDWICAAGTLVVDRSLGERALRAAYAAFLEGGISSVRTKAIGHYALAIKQGSRITLFVDPLGAFQLFYWINANSWFAANSLSLCAGAISEQRLDISRLLVNAIQTNLPGEETFFAGIRRLFGTQAIVIDLNSQRAQVEMAPQSKDGIEWGSLSMQDAIDRYVTEVRSVFSELTMTGSIGLFGTGGMDSRMVLACLLDQGASVRLMYGVGNSRLTDFDQRDQAVAQQIAQAYRLPFATLDWSGTQPFSNSKLRDLFDLHGFGAEIYGASDGFLNALAGGIHPYPDLLFGGYSPALTNAKPWEMRGRQFSFDDLLNDCMRFQGGPVLTSTSIRHKSAYRDLVAGEIMTGLTQGGIPFSASDMSLEVYVRARLFLYVRAEARLLNLVNEFTNYLAPFMLMRLYRPLLAIPLTYRERDEFQLRIIQALNPGLMNVPLFSGIRQARIDCDTVQFVPLSEGARGRSGYQRTRAIPAVLRRPLRRVVNGLAVRLDPLKRRDAAIVRDYSARILAHPLGRDWFVNTADFTPKDLARICHYLVGVEAFSLDR